MLAKSQDDENLHSLKKLDFNFRTNNKKAMKMGLSSYNYNRTSSARRS